MRQLLLATSLLALAACHRSHEAEPTLDFGAGDGISHRDDWGRPNGMQDPSDWTADSTWNEQEQALFSGFYKLALNLNGAQHPHFLRTSYVYPNPARAATWYVEANQPNGSFQYNVRGVLADEHYHRLMSYYADLVSSSGYTLNFDYARLGLQPGRRYRFYYVLCQANDLLSKGHGDLFYQE